MTRGELSTISNAVDALPPAQRQAIAAKAKAVSDHPAAPPMKLDLKDKTLAIGFVDCAPEIATLLQMADMGTNDTAFHMGLVGQIANLGSHGAKVDSGNSNFVLSVVRAVQPRDELESLLAAQMGAIHAATMMMARRLNHVETIPQQDSAANALNKLARTYATQLEALKRYRTGGQQKVTVEHVTVNAGGQAIVGAVSHGGRGAE